MKGRKRDPRNRRRFKKRITGNDLHAERLGGHSNTFGNTPEPHQTQRDPTKMKFTVDSLFNNDYWEWRMRAGDYMYSIS